MLRIPAILAVPGASAYSSGNWTVPVCGNSSETPTNSFSPSGTSFDSPASPTPSFNSTFSAASFPSTPPTSPASDSSFSASPSTSPTPSTDPPSPASSSSTNFSSASSSSLSTASPVTPSAPVGLSLAQQLLLADTLSDRLALLADDREFVFDFGLRQNPAVARDEFIAANRKTFPALAGTGSGMAVGRIGPCGTTSFHLHPRSAELQLIVQGRLVTQMIPESGLPTRRVIKNEVGPYQMTLFYQGSIHTQFNPDCTEATFVSAFANEDFGITYFDQTASANSSCAHGQIIAGEESDPDQADSITYGVEECLRQCNLKKRKTG